MFTYKAEVVKVVDGDTIDVDIDLGFKTWVRNVRLRLNRIDAYETRLYKGTTEEQKQLGLKAKKLVEDFVEYNKGMVEVQTVKRGKYGRWIAEVRGSDDSGAISINLGEKLVSMGYAIYKKY